MLFPLVVLSADTAGVLRFIWNREEIYWVVPSAPKWVTSVFFAYLPSEETSFPLPCAQIFLLAE